MNGEFLGIAVAIAVALFFIFANEPANRRLDRRPDPEPVPALPPEPEPDLRDSLMAELQATRLPALVAEAEAMPAAEASALLSRNAGEWIASIGLDPTPLSEGERSLPLGEFAGFWQPHRLNRDRGSAGFPVGIAAPYPWATNRPADSQPVLVTRGDRKLLAHIIGASGSGKTNSAVQLVDDSVRQEATVVVIELRRDLAPRIMARLLMSETGEAEGRRAWELDPYRKKLLERIRILDYGDPSTVVGLNPLAGPGIAHTRAEAALEVIAARLDGIGVQVEHTLRNVIVPLAENGLTLSEIEPALTDESFLRALARRTEDASAKAFLADFASMGPDRRRTLVLPVLNKVQPFLSHPAARLSLGAPNPLDWQETLNERPGRIVLVSLAADQMRRSAGVIGGLVLAQITQAVFARDPRRNNQPVHLILDEFENFASPSMLELIAEGRKYGVSLTLAHQHLSQLPEELKEAVRANARITLAFSMGYNDAKRIAPDLWPGGGHHGMQHLMSLKTGEAVFLRRGELPVKVATPLTEEPDIPQPMAGMLRDASRSACGMGPNEAESAIRDRAARFAGGDDDDPPGTEVKHGKRPGR